MSEEEDEIVIRAKWIMDGSKTLSEASDRLKEFAVELEHEIKLLKQSTHKDRLQQHQPLLWHF